MTLFWTLCGALIALSLAFGVLPLFRRSFAKTTDLDALNVDTVRQQLRELDDDLANGSLDQGQYDAARRDLEKELLVDVSPSRTAAQPESSASKGRWMIPVLAVALPALAIAMYSALGNSEIIPRLAGRSALPPTSTAAPGDHDQLPPMEQLVERLAKRLESEPQNVDGWLMLARSYSALGRPADAMSAYDRALALDPQNVDALLSYAQMLAQSQGNRIAGRPAELIAKAAELDPQNPNALWLAGMSSFEMQSFAEAERYWQRLLPMLQPDSDDAAEVSRAIGEARARQGLGPVASPRSEGEQPALATAPGAEQAAAQTGIGTTTDGGSPGSIRVRVTLADALAESVKPTDRVFVFARASEGPRMPLAAASRSVSDLPISLVLSDRDSMVAGMTISAFPQIVVGARISSGGDAIPRSGDLEGESGPISSSHGELVEIVIDRVRP